MPEQDAATNTPAGTTAGGLYLVALIEGAKGVLVLLTGFGIMSLIHKDAHQVAVQLIQHFHFNPASRYPRIFIDAVSHTTDLRLWVIAAAALLYSTIRLIEAWGLWNRQQWAEWFGLVSGGIYIPLELYELIRSITMFKLAVLTINVSIVTYLLLMVLLTRRKQKT